MEFKATATDRASLMSGLKARIDDIGISQADLDGMIGWASGVTGKYFGAACVKTLGMDNFLLLLNALALRIELVPDLETAKRMERHWERWNAGRRKEVLRRPGRVAKIGRHVAKRMAKQLGQRGQQAWQKTLTDADREAFHAAGGKARIGSMTKKERSEFAKRALAIRYGHNLPEGRPAGSSSETAQTQ